MEAAGGPAAHALEQRLHERPGQFDFFQAVRRLECAYRGRSRVGKSEHPREEPFRFCQTTSLAFAPSSISGFEPAGESHPARLFVDFMGLLGPNGPLPLAITEYIYDRVHNQGDMTLARFLDLFNHRAISMFYRAWAACQIAVSRDDLEEWTFERFVGSLVGIGMESFRGGDSIPDEAKLHHAGPLSCQTKHPEGLEAFVSGYFRVPAQVVEFIGRWMDIPAEYRCLMGGPRENRRLGVMALLGTKAWNCDEKFRLRLGPMTLADYERMLPHTPSFRRLVDLVRNYIGDELIWDVQLVLRADEVPRARLGCYGQLGRTTWVSSVPRDRDASDAVVHESRIEALRSGAGKGNADG